MISTAINGLNGGRGLRAMTDHGWNERERLVRYEKQTRGIHWNADVHDLGWYQEIERNLFSPENEGVLWKYVRVTR